jgi:hypothetical protein
MGAGAAAFSSLRTALIAEGVSDMLLLPTLIRLATGKAELDYQVSPGIATASKSDMAKLDLIATRVAYLVDGDAGGAIWHGQLIEAKIPTTRIRSLPAGIGLEDLLDRSSYLDAVAQLGGLDRSKLDTAEEDLPIKTAIGHLKLKGVPGPIPVAEFLLGGQESHEVPIKLSATGKKLLRDLDKWVTKTLSLES